MFTSDINQNTDRGGDLTALTGVFEWSGAG